MSLGQRRLAAIMFTDMVGYTILGQKNEALSIALAEEQRKLLRPVIGRHNGLEIKTMGDAFLVEFPSALDAVRCAYDIQRATREFNMSMPEEKRVHLKIGVHMGDVTEAEGDISGDAVNVASRIEPLSEDGGVCITRQVYDDVQNKVDFDLVSIGLKNLKNVTRPVEVYKMVMPWSKVVAVTAELDKKRVAVLPFANMSPDPQDEYFSDGMTEELITSLAGVNGLSVIARTSVMKYKGGSKGASEVARELKAGTLIEGSVRKAGNRVRITVQLIDGQTESHSWAQSYDKQLDDIFAIQSDVAKQVAGFLQVRLLASEKKILEKPPTSNMEAYTLYLKGLHYFSLFEGPDGLKRAAKHFEEAIANDPTFAAAYAYLSYTYNQLGFFGMMSSSETGPKARELAMKAVELDPDSAEAHHALGRIIRNYDWDFEGAMREFRRAVELKPSFAEAYGAIAVLYQFNRQYDEALPSLQKVLELDPTSGRGTSYVGTVLLYRGREKEAIEMFNKTLEVNPKSAYEIGNRGLARIRMGDLEGGLDEVKSIADPKAAAMMNDLAYAYAKAGREDELRRLLERLLNQVKDNPEFSLPIAGAYANLGDPDKAMEWLEKSYDQHLAFLISANSDFAFDAIRSDPRFQSLMRKIGFTNVG